LGFLGDERDHKDTTRQNRAAGTRTAVPMRVYEVGGERAMEKAFKAGAYWWQIGEHFGMSQQIAHETVKRAKKKRARK
jgi:hypothetical protein